MLKQRLIGALVLVLLGAVLWPVVFVEPEEARQRGAVDVPRPPAVDTAPLPIPSAESLRSPLERTETDADPGENADVILPAAVAERLDAGEPEAAMAGEAQRSPPPLREEPPVQPQLDADGIPIAWALQVATVSSVQKADALRDELIHSGHKAFTRELRRDARVLHRVYVGPRFERAPLDVLKQDIDRQYGVDSLIVRYEP